MQQGAHGRHPGAHRGRGRGLRAQGQQPAGRRQLRRGHGGIAGQFVQQVRVQAGRAQVALGHLAAHRAWRRATGQGQQEAAQEGRVHAVGAVGDPDRRDRVFLQGAVDPALLLAGLAAAEQGEKEIAGLEDVLHFVEDQQGVAAAGQQALGQQVGR